MLRCDLRKLLGHFFEYALPKPTGMGHGVRFVTEKNAFARRSVELFAALAILKSETDNTFDSFTSVDIFLDGDFVLSSLFENAACICVNALGVFAQHNEIDVFGLDAFERTERRIEQANRANICVEIHFEAHAEKNFLGMYVGRHPRISEGAEQDGIEFAAQHRKTVGRNGHAVDKITVSTPIKFSGIDGSA